jgi:Rrf2 family transcriptional regulator, iron-sulfur cluster assembly transcription factor
MKLSTKIRYGVRALCDMVDNPTGAPAQIKDISKRQSLSARYIEQIFQKLKKAGIIKSVRGRSGGYLLTKKSEEITIGDVIRAIEGKDIRLVACLSKKKGAIKVCERFGDCAPSKIWEEASKRLMDYFNTVFIKEICNSQKQPEG